MTRSGEQPDLPGAEELDGSRPDPLLSGVLPDEAARLRIVEALQENLLVEAGAGSGKTTALVDRMVALVRSRAAQVGEIAAVTFTRKAAADLRQRFQVELERALADTPPDDPARAALEQAVRDIDEAFLGTIHAFCAKLLRERPLEAGLDPGFREVLESEAYRMQRTFWVEFLERLAAEGDPDLGELTRIGIAPDALEEIFGELVENPDVDFGFEPVEAPSEERIRSVRARFEALLDRAFELMPDEEPARGWDSLARKIRTWGYSRRARDWDQPVALFDALTEVRHLRTKLVQNRWSDTGQGKAAAKALQESFHELGAEGGELATLVEAWWAHRYPVVMGFARRAADAFARERKERGRLNFQDLLVLTADLLRSDPVARRDLGQRYKRLLVDEFQDTDPLQAEIILLLASNPGSSRAGSEGLDLAAGTGEDWRDVVPRAGSLFVVGDPKQSIYRFRRADISLYEFVKDRFQAFGHCLRLEANFRSLPAIGDLVEGVFGDGGGFPEAGTDSQAAYAPLLTQRTEGPGVLATYVVEGANQDQVARDEARRIAACIARRVEELGQGPGDFMVLTRTRKYLSTYARAIEDQGLPVEVSGAGVGFEEELRGLLLLLRALADPENAVRVLGSLTGPFFGVRLDDVVRFREKGGRLSISRAPDGEGPVIDALRTLHEWWLLGRRQPADLALEQIVREAGLFPLAAGGPLGQLRAGALMYVLDAVRARTLAGDPSIFGAVDAMETALAWDDAEAPLVPGRQGAVQVMNLHRAKGLEAPVVFLAAPFGDSARRPTMRVSRDAEGLARGTMQVARSSGRGVHVLAQPLSWPRDENEEQAFQDAEKVRLLYVAATRARNELWVARGRGLPRASTSPSPWLAVESWLEASGHPVVSLEASSPPPVAELEATDRLGRGRDRVRASREQAAAPTYALETVTAIAKGAAGAAGEGRGPEDDSGNVDGFRVPEAATTRGYEWGSVVHQALAAAASGLGADALRQVCRQALVEFDRPVDRRGEPVELDELLDLVGAVMGSDLWARAAASTARFTEMPFAVNRGEAGSPPDVVEGVIDLVFREEAGWVVADYKTDRGDDPDFERRVHQYRAQVDLYASCWERATGDPVAERVVVFTVQGRAERW